MPAPASGLFKKAPVAPPPSAWRPAVLQAAELPFGLVRRSVVDQQLRSPHRQHFPDQLVEVVAHWAGGPAPVLDLPRRDVPVMVRSTDESVAVRPPAAPPPARPVNVRLLLCSTSPADSDRHLLKRMEVLAGNRVGEPSHVSAYGGLCEDGEDDELVLQLVRMLREQTGVDLSGVRSWHKLLELRHVSGPATVFFLPAIWELEGGLEVLPQVAEVPAAAGETPGAKRRRTVDGQELERRRTITPLKFQLSGLLGYRVHAGTHQDTLELCMAADALDECVKREMATRMVSVLQRRKAEAAERDAESDQQQSRSRQRNERRQRRDAALKAARLAEEEATRSQWVAEDQGKTDDEKRDVMVARCKQLQELRGRRAAEDLAQAEADQAENLEDERKHPPRGVVHTFSQAAHDCFAYFDRSSDALKLSGCIPRLKLENLLLCLGSDATLGDVNALLDIPQLAGATTVDYRDLAHDVSLSAEKRPDR
eukprot:TRINITY_DN26743_c0_g5_i1.p1 TRINITY_DN26743_c0_g5~~TRINITY_DN26743_c0_g5_i1.p1  ORF type:complete len:500 (+),score=190.68 TRINITY_DN26743_c0_g5_i1:58-1500(+)